MRRLIALAAGVTTALALLQVAAAGEDVKEPPPTFAEDETVPAPPGDPDAPAVAEFTVAAQTSTTCPGGSIFDNPVAHYTACIPDGWGFSDLDAPEPLEEMRGSRLENLRLLSPEAFPWQPGEQPLDAVLDGIVEIELRVLDRAEDLDGCAPVRTRASAASDMRTCRGMLDALGLPAVSGPVVTLTGIVPLAQPTERVHALADPIAGSLLIVARIAASNPEGVDRAWRVIDSLRVY